MAENSPFVLARFDWSRGRLVLRFVKRARSRYYKNRPDVYDRAGTTDPREAYRWNSRQAARQFLLRGYHLSDEWKVTDLRRIGWRDVE